MRGIRILDFIPALNVAANAKGYAFRRFGSSSCGTYADITRTDH